MQKINNDSIRIKNIKKCFLDNAHRLHLGHLPSALSSLEILYVLYNKIANITNENVDNGQRDRVIISKEHCRFAQACVLVENGLLDASILDSYLQNGSLLGHDIYNVVGSPKVAAVDVSSGSLGHGLGVGGGLAWGGQNQIFVVLGDGELQEGTCWEAAMFAGQNQLSNLTAIIDCNKVQLDNFTKEIINTSEMAAGAFKSFGFDVFECDGHNIEELEKTLKIKSSKPKCVIAHTIKGKELLHMRQNLGFAFSHWSGMNENDYKLALEEIERGSI